MACGFLWLSCVFFCRAAAADKAPVRRHSSARKQPAGVVTLAKAQAEKEKEKGGKRYPSVYCFMVIMPQEEPLLRTHLELGTLQGCDGWDVFSNATSFATPMPVAVRPIAAVKGPM